jgi:hypothetical protein
MTIGTVCASFSGNVYTSKMYLVQFVHVLHHCTCAICSVSATLYLQFPC